MAEAAKADLGEIIGLLSALPGPDEAAATQAADREGQLTKPPGALGRLEEIAAWFCAWQGRHPPRLDRPRVAVFAGNHGIAAAKGVSAFPVEVTAQMVANFQAGGAAVNQLCQVFDADLRVYELALDHPTADFSEGPAMTRDECATAMAYGMMAVEDGIDLLCLGEMGIGNTTSAAALSAALFGGSGTDWAGPGTGVTGDALSHKAAMIDQALDVNKDALNDPIDTLCALGGFELAAMAGAIIAARMGRVPVLLDGYVVTAAAAVLEKARPGALDHCLAAHVSAEPAHANLLQKIDKKPLLDLGMRLGEGSGAAVAIGIVKSAVACHAGMATFAEAGVSEE